MRNTLILQVLAASFTLTIYEYENLKGFKNLSGLLFQDNSLFSFGFPLSRE